MEVLNNISNLNSFYAVGFGSPHFHKLPLLCLLFAISRKAIDSAIWV